MAVHGFRRLQSLAIYPPTLIGCTWLALHRDYEQNGMTCLASLASDSPCLALFPLVFGLGTAGAMPYEELKRDKVSFPSAARTILA